MCCQLHSICTLSRRAHTRGKLVQQAKELLTDLDADTRGAFTIVAVPLQLRSADGVKGATSHDGQHVLEENDTPSVRDGLKVGNVTNAWPGGFCRSLLVLLS
jgi:hypothetical protein